VTEGSSGAGLSRVGSLGSKVAVRGFKGKRRRGVGPGLTAVFPRFSYPDVNFWIWYAHCLYPYYQLTERVFGRRYRQVVRGWEASIKGPDRHADRRYVCSTDPLRSSADSQYELVRSSNGYILHCRQTGFGCCHHHQGFSNSIRCGGFRMVYMEVRRFGKGTVKKGFGSNRPFTTIIMHLLSRL